MGSLVGRRILVTRPQGRGSRLAELLTAAGAEPILIPTIALEPPASFCALDAALTALRSFDWVLFTSAYAVEVFAMRANRLGLLPTPRRVAVIGPATARAVVERGVRAQVDLVPEVAVAESLAEALRPHASAASMLLVRAAVARDALPDALIAAGAQVTIAEAYHNVIPAESVTSLQALLAAGAERRLDAVTFTSGSTAANLHVLLGAAQLTLPPDAVLASIGPITSRAMRDVGWEPGVESGVASIEGLVQALAEAFTR